MGQDESGTLARLKDHLRQLINPKIVEYGGRVVKTTGDGLLCEFPSVVEAVRCTVDVQRGMAERNVDVPEDQRIVFRIGVNVGDVIIDGDDIFGDGVNVAARLQTLADLGGICVGRGVRDQVLDKLGFTFEDLGSQQVKNIVRPVEVFRIALAGSGSAAVADGSRSGGASAVRRDEPTGSTIVPSAPVTRTNSIAVLPFANMSAERDQEFFYDGLAEEIINLLAHVPDLRVIARTSAFAFRGKEQDIRAIADALGVSHVLEGSVRRAGNRLRITGQLIDAADGTHLWSERYDRDLSDIFAIQDEIAAAIVGALRIKLSQRSPRHRYTPNLPSYEAYLKATHLVAKVTPDSLELARHCYEEAIALDRDFALPHIGLGHYWCSLMMFGRIPAHEAVLAARAEARTALDIDPSLPEAHALLGILAAMYDMDWTEAERHFEFPMAKEVSFGTFRPIYGWCQFLRGRPRRAIELALDVIKADPLDVWPRMNLQAYLQAAERDSEALEALQKVLELDPHQVAALVAKAMIHADRGDLGEALAISRRAHAIAPWYPDATAVLAAVLRRDGDVAESRRLEQTLGSGESPGDAHVRAQFHLLCGELAQGADWTERAIEERDPAMFVYLRFAVCRELRASLRWSKIARMMNLAE